MRFLDNLIYSEPAELLHRCLSGLLDRDSSRHQLTHDPRPGSGERDDGRPGTVVSLTVDAVAAHTRMSSTTFTALPSVTARLTASNPLSSRTKKF
ncbi:hypothetical protein E2C01_078466 [Portunus trituberculatus]|uniref:Uncharacterized protein n=1 Tax=Portunus trituberculatus TaxID=210409 RepID=A0A5B7IH11_PORTR|nr:hypothetical protein [Portunus trituberculatus]